MIFKISCHLWFKCVKHKAKSSDVDTEVSFVLLVSNKQTCKQVDHSSSELQQTGSAT